MLVDQVVSPTLIKSMLMGNLPTTIRGSMTTMPADFLIDGNGDDATVARYKGFGIDLEKASGQTPHALPIPAIYVVSKDGVVTFALSNLDYRQRLDANDLLKEISK